MIEDREPSIGNKSIRRDRLGGSEFLRALENDNVVHFSCSLQQSNKPYILELNVTEDPFIPASIAAGSDSIQVWKVKPGVGWAACYPTTH